MKSSLAKLRKDHELDTKAAKEASSIKVVGVVEINTTKELVVVKATIPDSRESTTVEIGLQAAVGSRAEGTQRVVITRMKKPLKKRSRKRSSKI